MVCSTPMSAESEKLAAAALLQWYAEMGVDEAIGPDPSNFFDWGPPAPVAAPSQIATGQRTKPTPASRQPSTLVQANDALPPADKAIELAKSAASSSKTIDELSAAIDAFDACALKAGARNTVFVDGTHGADLLIIGEAPDRDEDKAGKPFIGRSGLLLDKMLAAIGRSRTNNTLISNIIFWRPPGNRAPTEMEAAICRPFIDRLIELTAPKAIVLAGGTPAQTMLGASSIMRARGTWQEIQVGTLPPIPTMPMLHPTLLLRQPAQKRMAWADLISLEARLTRD